jgi:hypothetical protein
VSKVHLKYSGVVNIPIVGSSPRFPMEAGIGDKSELLQSTNPKESKEGRRCCQRNWFQIASFRAAVYSILLFLIASNLIMLIYDIFYIIWYNPGVAECACM